MNKVGRPTEYSEEILEKARAYYKKLPADEVIHSIEGLAEAIDVARSTIYEWRSQETKKEFSDIVEKVFERQGKFLINNGLTGRFSSKITMALLSKHGYAERKEITGAEGKDLFPSDEEQKKIDEAFGTHEDV